MLPGFAPLPRAPGPASLVGVRNTVGFVRDPLGFLAEQRDAHGDIVSVRLAGARWLVVSHPDDIETLLVKHAADVGRDEFTDILKRVLGEGLLTSEGDLWKRQRRLLATAFTPKRIRGYAESMGEITERVLARLPHGEETSLHHAMSELTLEVVAEVLFGASVSPHDVGVVRSSMEVFNDFFGQSPEAVFQVPAWVPTPRLRAVRRARAELDSLLFRIIDARRGAPPRGDLLGAMLAAADDDGTKMSDEQLRDETVTLFLAGHETTALALTYALYLLALHPEIEARAADEVRSTLEGRRPTADDVPRLAYLERVLKEAMRLYPPAWVIGREVLKPITLGGVRVEPGVQVVASQWLVHRDARFWPEPERFDPSRFEPSASEGRRRFAYFPFGGGPRVCIGNHFAMMEAVILLALVLARFRVELVPGQTLGFAPSVTLQPKAPGLRVVLRPRG